MLKICHITSVHPRYDVRIFVKECVTLANHGYQVSLIVADNLITEEIRDRVVIYSVGKPLDRKDRLQHTGKKIFNKVLELSPDIVHFHDPELMGIGAKLSKLGYKVVYDVHEDLPKQVLNKHWLPKLIRPLVSLFVTGIEKFYAKRFAGVITATPIISRRFKSYNDNTVTICNYPLLAEIKISQTTWENRQDLLCYIGSISETRGIKQLVESLAVSQIKLKLAGSFSGGLGLPYLQNLSGGNYVDYLGILNREEITHLLQQVKVGIVTLLPTPSYLESLPIKMFEYMLAGIPVIASDFPLWHEIITKYDCGILVDPKDKEAIATACTYLLNHQESANQMGQNGYFAVLNHFNWECEQVNFLKFYEKLH